MCRIDMSPQINVKASCRTRNVNWASLSAFGVHASRQIASSTRSHLYLTKISPQTVLSGTVNIQLNQWSSLYLPPVFNAHDRHEHP